MPDRLSVADPTFLPLSPLDLLPLSTLHTPQHIHRFALLLSPSFARNVTLKLPLDTLGFGFPLNLLVEFAHTRRGGFGNQQTPIEFLLSCVTSDRGGFGRRRRRGRGGLGDIGSVLSVVFGNSSFSFRLGSCSRIVVHIWRDISIIIII